MVNEQLAGERIALLETLLRDYYTAAQIGETLEDATDEDLEEYEQRMKELQRRCAALLGMEEQERQMMAEVDEANRREASTDTPVVRLHTRKLCGSVI